jgi:hypothetical protein
MLAIYKEEQGGVPLWQETQNVSLDANGTYTAMLGITQKDGVPGDLFSSTEPRWLGVQFTRTGEVEQPRVQLVTVPLALKAVDAGTLAGKPAPTDFVSPTGLTTDPRDDGPTATSVSILDVAGDSDFSGSVRYRVNPVVLGHSSPGPLGNGDLQSDLNGFTVAVGNGMLNRLMKKSTPMSSPILLAARLRR